MVLRFLNQNNTSYLLGVLLISACGYQVEDGELYPGGETTNTFLQGSNAFILPAENMHVEHEPSFYTGNSFFNQSWVETPASTQKRDGLGPFFNARSCASCHFKDGRGAPPEDGEPFLSLLLKVGMDEEDEYGQAKPSPKYGGQIQNFSILAIEDEAQSHVEYVEISGQYGDGSSYSLIKPTYTITDSTSTQEVSELHISPRIAPVVIGMGLLESIPLSRLESLADPYDDNNDGISGRINWVWDEKKQDLGVGRFGWKAEITTVEQQVATAFVHDIGITNPIFSEHRCGTEQLDCQDQPYGGTPEIEQDLFDKVVLYSSLLAVPMRRNWEERTVQEGKVLFHEVGCASCHVPNHTTASEASFVELIHQNIWPYTDLLLHDMGEGLADGLRGFQASGAEWRTPPLWGIGLVEKVNRHTRFLHDGRARNLTEAILWHGGEAETSKNLFQDLSMDEREAIVSFVRSL